MHKTYPNIANRVTTQRLCFSISGLILIGTLAGLGGCQPSGVMNSESAATTKLAGVTTVQNTQQTSKQIRQENKSVNANETHQEHADHEGQEVEAMGMALALATDSKHYAAAYGVSHTEAMRRMLVQHDTQAQTDALRAEFGDKILGMGFVDDPEYGFAVFLSGSQDDTPPPVRYMTRPADKVEGKRDVIDPVTQLAQPEPLRLTQAEVDMATTLIGSPIRFPVVFKISANGKNLTEAERQAMDERSNQLRERISMLAGTSYDNISGEYVIYVQQSDAEKAGLTKEKLKQIGEEVMQMPVQIVWQQGYATLDIAMPVEALQ